MEETITFCILNFYEDWLVCRAIAQVYNYVDEILIGDCSKGKDFLASFTRGLKKVRIVKDPGWDAEGPNFSWAQWRNYVQSFAKGDWILWIDPDEIYSLEMMKHLKEWIKDIETEAVGFIRVAYLTHRRIKALNKEVKIRLWRNNRRIKWKGKIHENPTGYRDYTILDVEYSHDIAWLPSFPQRIYKLKKRERRGNILPRIKKNDLDPFRERFPDEKEEDAFTSRE